MSRDRIKRQHQKRAREYWNGDEKARRWNARHPVGLAVSVQLVRGGETLVTRTRSEAWALGDGTVVVLVEGRTGGYLVDLISPVVEDRRNVG